MNAERYGSYSMLATFAGMFFLSYAKSTKRYAFLCPPPLCRIVMRPKLFRPPDWRFPFVSAFSGRVPLKYLRYSMVVFPRELFVTGLYVFIVKKWLLCRPF